MADDAGELHDAVARKDPLTPAGRSELMSRIGAKDTQPELLLRRALWSAGVRGWRLHVRAIPGCPDLAWRGRRVAVFVDGAFWHGHPDYYAGQSGPFWNDKIQANRARDAKVTAALAESGWRVVRIWDFEIQKDLDACVARVVAVLERC